MFALLENGSKAQSNNAATNATRAVRWDKTKTEPGTFNFFLAPIEFGPSGSARRVSGKFDAGAFATGVCLVVIFIPFGRGIIAQPRVNSDGIGGSFLAFGAILSTC